MSEPVISVIIPTLNEEARLPKLLNALAAQTLKAIEVKVVDAGSEDQTPKIVEAFADRLHVSFIAADQKNVGRQRNMGAQASSAPYVVFIDADVTFAVDFLEKLYSKMLHSQTDFAATRGIPDTNHWYDHALTYMTYRIMWLSAYFGKPFMSGENIIFKKSVFDAIGEFDTTVIQADDHECVQRAARKGYKGRLFMDITHQFSFRRFEREGRLTVILKYLKATYYVVCVGPIRKPIYEYKMGGKVD